MKTMIWMIIFTALVAGCAPLQGKKVKIPLENDPRVGAEVQQLCFTQSLDAWQNVDNDKNAVILKMHNRDRYKLKLSSSCDPDWAFTTIAVITRPGSGCLSRGDRLKTDGDMSRGYGSACTILRINKWNPDAVRQASGLPESE